MAIFNAAQIDGKHRGFCRFASDMYEIIYEGKELNSWMDYINARFNYPSLFKIENDEHNLLTVIYSLTNKTKIYFNWVEEKKGVLLSDCQFSNEDYKGWSGETFQYEDEGLLFNQENFEFVDDIVDIPVFKGWLSIEYYLGKLNYKNESYADKYKLEKLSTEYNWYAPFFFPIISTLLKMRIIGHKKEAFVEPIIQSP